MATAQDRLNQILPSWYDLLTQWSLDGSLVAAATDAMMLESSNAKEGCKGLLQSYVAQWSAGNFQGLPQILLLSAADISGARGAYADSTDTIYLNQEWLHGASAEEIQKVLTEELGHYLDDSLNSLDTKGDEGEKFSGLLLLNPVSQALDDNDHITISVGNADIQAEAASQLEVQWTKTEATTDGDYAYAIAADGNNGVYLGRSASTLTLSASGSRIDKAYLTKYDQDGSIIWEKTQTGTGIGYSAIAVSADGSVYAGCNYSEWDGGQNYGVANALFEKYSSDGALLWRQVLYSGVITPYFKGGGYDAITDIAIDDLGYIYLAGSTNGGDTFGGQDTKGFDDIFLSKYDPSGQMLWTRIWGSSTDNESATALTVGGDGGIYLAGNHNLSNRMGVDLDPDAFVVKYSSEGSLIWERTIDSGRADFATSIEAAKDGSIYIAGSTEGDLHGESNHGSVDGFIIRYNQSGEVLSTDLIGSSAGDCITGASVSSSGSIYFAGWTDSSNINGIPNPNINNPSYFARCGLILKYTNDGQLEWTDLNAYNGHSTLTKAIDASLDGKIYTTSDVYFDLVEGVSSNNGDYLLAEYQDNTFALENRAPTAVTLVNIVTSLQESASTAIRIKVAEIQITDDGLGANAALLSGTDASFFEVDAGVVYLKAGAVLDFETNPSLEVTVSVADSTIAGSAPVTASYALAITDVNEASTAVILANKVASLPENTATTSRIKVADIQITDDALGTNSVSLFGADAALFEADNGVLYLKAGAVLDSKTNPSLDVTVSVSDITVAGSLPVTASYALAITDVLPPSVSSIAVEGTAVILTFSEAVTAVSVPPGAFSVQTVNSKNSVSTIQITAVALNQNDARQVILTLGGTAPASNVNVRVSYTDPSGFQTTGVVQDVSGNDLASFSNVFADTFRTSSTTTLASQYRNLTLTGGSNANGTGNSLDNIIIGNAANNTLSGLGGNDIIRGEAGTDILIGGAGGDVLTGGAGNDTFRLALTDSLLINYDKITDFAIGSDSIDGPTAITAANVKDGVSGSIYGVGSVQSIDVTGISNLLNSSGNFAANGASIFTYNDPTAGLRTFLALNNGTATFSAASDAIIEITGYSGSLANLAIV